MLKEMKDIANMTLTENGAATYRSTGSECLDLFGTVGGMRNQSDDEIIKRFERAYADDADTAMKILFFARDVRGGLGERRIFRTIVRYIASTHTESLFKNIRLFPEYGRWDDLLELIGTPCEAAAIALIKEQISEDLVIANTDIGSDSVSLLAKWLPSVNASSRATRDMALYLADALGMTPANYRKTLSLLRAEIGILENNLRTREYDFDYSKQPAKAMFKYRRAFIRNDSERYGAFLNDVREGKATMHTGTLMPYEIISPVIDYLEEVKCEAGLKYKPESPYKRIAEERKAIDTTWNSQENFAGDKNALVVVDGSGSMYCVDNPMPAAVAMSLGIYFGERNTGAFANHFITFSRTPQLVEIKGEDIFDKVEYCMSYNEVADTNIQAVFELILDAAVRNNVPQEEMPETIYIVSDMEFNWCTTGADITNFEYAKQIFAEAGYRLPQVVFWDVDSREQQLPVTKNEQGVTLVSGCTPRLFSMVLEGCTPYEYMMAVLNSPRYLPVSA